MESETNANRELQMALQTAKIRHRQLLGTYQVTSKWISFLGHTYNGFFANARWVTQNNQEDASFKKALFSEIFPELNRTANENIDLWKTIRRFLKCLDNLVGTVEEPGDVRRALMRYVIETSLEKELEARQVCLSMPQNTTTLPLYFHGIVNYIMEVVLDVLVCAMPSGGPLQVGNFWKNQHTYCLSFQVDPFLLDLDIINRFFLTEKENFDLITDKRILEMALLDDLLMLLGGELVQPALVSTGMVTEGKAFSLLLELPIPGS